MKRQHKNLAAGDWEKLSLMEQMANIGGEVERAINWRVKGNGEFSKMAFERALELLDLTLAAAHQGPKLKEIARVREAAVDYFAGSNEYGSSDELWKKYFYAFNWAARNV